MASATVAFNAIVVEALNQHNYRYWSSQIKTYLLAKDIWDVVEEETPESENGEVELSKDWRRKDAKALHAIKVCCGMEAFSFIGESSTAKIAWEVLEKNFNSPSCGSTPVPERKARDEEEEISHHTITNDAGQTHYSEEILVPDVDLELQASDGGNENGDILKRFFGYVKDGDLGQAMKLVSEPGWTWPIPLVRGPRQKRPCPTLLRARDPVNGCTALHYAVSYGHDYIVRELGSLLSQEDLVIEETTNGNTALHIAVHKGDMTILKQLVELMREVLGVQNSRGETVLHTALTAVVQKADIAARIVASYLVNSMRAEDLEIKDKEGYTALGRLLNGSNHESVLRELVESMIKKNSKLLTIGSPPNNHIPVVEASAWSRWSLCHYLYALTREDTLLPGKEVESMNGSQGAQLLNMCIRHPKGHDIACDLLRYRPRLAFVENGFGSYPMLVLARLHFAFLSGKRLTFWQKWIYDCMYIQPADFGTELEDDEDNLVNQIFSKMLVLGRLLYILLRRLIYTFLKLLGYNHLFEMKRIHVQVLNCMSNVTRNREGLTPVEQNIVTDSVLKAIEHGHTEFVIHMCKAYPELVDTNIDQKSRDIFQHAIECRQGEIYSLIYGHKKERRNAVAVDLRSSLLHIAANYSSLTRSNQDASLQMQRELQWFKEVESIVPFETHEYLNSSNGLTARELFTKNHAELKKEAEESMKGTATSCTTVCALIVTIMFAVAFTVPGGTDSATGLPMFMHKKLFRVFILSDTISLVSSATSVITFLGLLTSTYAEDDFLWSLPKKMMIGLSTLFISIAAMMITFSCTLTIMLDGEAKMIIPVIMFASVPVVSFAFYLFPLLFEICRSTYGPSMFPKKAGV